jgi:hypothetical protein
MVGGWRKLRNEELQYTYASACIIRMIKSRSKKWGYVARRGEKRNTRTFMWESQKGKRTLGRPRRRWEHSIKMDIRETE